MKKLSIIFSASLLLGACTIPGISQKEEISQAEIAVESTDSAKIKESSTYSLDDVVKHSTPEDCWLLIDGKIYDMTGFAPKHPGEEEVYDGCGIDASNLYETRPHGSGTPHSEKARSMLVEFEIGALAE